MSELSVLLSCRFCESPVRETFVDLGATPLCESFLRREDLNRIEPFYPLRAFVCGKCYLVQVPTITRAKDIFTHYDYFSSYSDAWLAHARRYTEMIISRFDLNASSRVIEIASNDGYLLRWFIEKGIRALGIEPAANIAKVAEAAGIPTLPIFFNGQTARELASRGEKADLLIGNNVLAQVPELNEFIAGMKMVLGHGGVITMEFPHLMKLVDQCQFDTIYHEHFSYFSFLTVRRIFSAHGLTLFDVDELETHGGSLRIYAKHSEDLSKKITARVAEMESREKACGLESLQYYSSFGERVQEVKRKLLERLIEIKCAGKRIAAYGAPGKGNTLLNYCGIRTDFIDYVVDRSPHKQNKFTPGTRIPIYGPERVCETKPDYLLVLPWNLRQEILAQMSYIREWGGRFIIPIPEARIC